MQKGLSFSDNSRLRTTITVRYARNTCVIYAEESENLRRWDLTMASLLVYVCFVTPYEVAFMPSRNAEWLWAGADALFWFNRLVDIAFLSDMVLQFFIAVTQTDVHGTVVVSKPTQIAKRYLQTWFLVDFTSILPYDLAGMLMESKEMEKLRVLRAVRLMRLLKLARLLRSLRILRRWELSMDFSYRHFTLWSLFALVIIAAHWISCILGLMSSIQGQACKNDGADACAITWFSASAEAFAEANTELTPMRTYIVALHVASTIIVHPHASPPTNDFERIIFIILVFLGGFIWTRVISRTTAVQTSLDRHSIHYRQTMDDLNERASNLRLPAPLRRRLRSFFVQARVMSQHQTWCSLTNNMSPQLQMECAVQMHKNWILRVPYLSGVPQLFVSHLSTQITVECYSQQEVFGANFTLYIMQRGICSKGGKKIRLMHPGSVWGAEHLLLNAWWLLEPNTVRALTFSEIMSLSRHSFEDIRANHPEVDDKMRKHYLRFVVIRGIMYAAEVKKVKENQDRLESKASMILEDAIIQHRDNGSCYHPQLLCPNCHVLCEANVPACANCGERFDTIANQDHHYAHDHHEFTKHAQIATSKLKKTNTMKSNVSRDSKDDLSEERDCLPLVPSPTASSAAVGRMVQPDANGSALEAMEKRLNDRMDAVLSEVRKGQNAPPLSPQSGAPSVDASLSERMDRLSVQVAELHGMIATIAAASVAPDSIVIDSAKAGQSRSSNSLTNALRSEKDKAYCCAMSKRV